MERHSNCSCALLSSWAQDPKVPLIFDPFSEKYYWLLPCGRSIEIKFCWFCGGKDEKQDCAPDSDRSCPQCECGLIPKLAQEPSSAVQYDARLNEYVIPGIGLVYFCIECGGRMPLSNRSQFFAQPSEEETRDFREKTKDLRTVDQVLSRFGEPDDLWYANEWNPVERRIYNPKELRRQLNYTKPWKTLDMIILEYEDGKLFVAYYGKFIGKEKRDNKKGTERREAS